MSKRDALEAYRAKRSPDRSPEPAGIVGPAGARAAGIFVVQKHAARRLHHDFRLELDGVLLSWAVPKGPSYDQANKRVAVQVEDHPLEYADFEGVIPPGNYGAGEVIVWDRGIWMPVEDPRAGLEKGKLLFDLRGHKLRGRWTLVKIKKSEKDWLLIKERDALEGPDRDDLPDDSVLSGLTLANVAAGVDRTAELASAAEELGAPRRDVDGAALRPMLAETRERPFDREGWLFELKYDGWRIIAGVRDGNARLYTRNGTDATSRFPDLADALSRLPCPDFVLDGEVIIQDDVGRPSFQRLQQRAQLRRATDIQRAAIELPASLYAFDLLAVDGFDLRALPLRDRKRLLHRLLPRAGALRYSDHVEHRGVALFGEVERMGLEGIVAKKATSPYRAGRRSADWIKVRSDRVGDFAVVGYLEGSGSRRGGLGSLHLAALRDGRWIYIGRVGSGLTEKQLGEVEAELERHRRDEPICDDAPSVPGRASQWAEPTLVAEVRYKEITGDGLLRQPVLLGLRDDKRPEECAHPEDGVAESIGEDASEAEADDSAVTASPRSGPAAARPARSGAAKRGESEAAADDDEATDTRVPFTNLDKVLWPEDGFTKGDLIGYYGAVSEWLLPYLHERPVVLTRYPDGIHGKSFFQKDAPAFAPDWLRRVSVWSEDSQRELSYFVVENEDGLLYLANMASIPLHIWSSRVGSLERPDWTIVDLDPKDAPFDNVVRLARALHALCEEAAIPAFAKTTGSSGLHVLVPLAGRCTHEQARLIAELLARIVVAEHPDIATLTRHVSRRGGKVYLDTLQNGYGKLLVAPFSVRPLEGAPVSMPLRWTEVRKGLHPRRDSIASAPGRLKRRGDPLAPLLETEFELVPALERLAAILGDPG